MMDKEMMTIEEKLKSLWRQERRFYHVRGASRFILWLIAMLAVDFIIDWGILFRVNSDLNIGLLMLIVNLGVLGYVLWNEWLKHLKPFDPVVVALEVENRHPELASVLVSYTQFPEGSRDEHASPELLEAMRQQARDLTRTIDFREVVDFAQIRKLLMVCGGITVFFLVISINWSAHTNSLIRRLGGLDETYPTRTEIVDPSGDLMVRAGDSVVVTVGAEGVIPDEGTLFVRSDDKGSDWQTAPMILGGAGSGKAVFEQTVDDVNQDLLYYIKLGDDRSDVYRIKPVFAPIISKVSIKRSYLPYLGLKTDTSSELTGSVPEGSSLVWKLTTDSPVSNLVVVVGEKKIKAVQEGDNQNWTFSLDKVKSSFKYTFLWTEAISGKGFEYDDVEHDMEVVMDTVPKVELLQPTLDALATVNKRVTLKAKVQDDHGLDEAWLTYTIDEGEEKRVPIPIDFKGQKRGMVEFVWDLKKSIEDLKPDMRLSFFVQVKDQYPNGGSHEAGSMQRRLTVVDKQRYIEWYQAELTTRLNDVKRAQTAEEEAAKALKQLIIQEGVQQ